MLIDEFGSGTEPVIGGAIAEAILERLLAKGCYGVITTHYANIKYYASNTEGHRQWRHDVRRAEYPPAVPASEMGKPGSSFAVEIARKIGLPEDIIRAAGEKAGSDHINIEKQLREIARDKHYWEQKRDRIRQTDRKVEELEQTYAGQLSKIRPSGRRYSKGQAGGAAADRRCQPADREYDQDDPRGAGRKGADAPCAPRTGRFPRRGGEKADTADKDAEVAREIERIERRRQRREERKAQRRARRRRRGLPLPRLRNRARWEAGSKVRMAGQDMVGVVQSVKGRKGAGRLRPDTDYGRPEDADRGLEQRVPRGDTPADGARTVVSADISARKLSFKDHIDVRGMRAAEALDAVQDFIDDALMVGVGSVSILHGKGHGGSQGGDTPLPAHGARGRKRPRRACRPGRGGITIVTFDLS